LCTQTALPPRKRDDFAVAANSMKGLSCSEQQRVEIHRQYPSNGSIKCSAGLSFKPELLGKRFNRISQHIDINQHRKRWAADRGPTLIHVRAIDFTANCQPSKSEPGIVRMCRRRLGLAERPLAPIDDMEALALALRIARSVRALQHGELPRAWKFSNVRMRR